MKHIHHIVPKYLGGTNDPENLVELTVEEHAEAHRLLYEKHGDKRDWLAWQGLLGMIGKEEIIRELQSFGGKKAGGTRNWTNESFEKVRETALRNQRKATNAALSEKSRAKRSITLKQIKHQQGEKNSQFGTMWIHSLVEKRCKKIQKGDPIPEGWFLGRKMKFR